MLAGRTMLAGREGDVELHAGPGLRIMLEELAPRLPVGLHRSGSVTRARSTLVFGIETLPIPMLVPLA